MPVISDFSIARFEDGILTINLAPAVAIGGWDLRLQISNRLGSTSGLLFAYVGSGMNNQSGLNILNSGQGQLAATIPGSNFSGQDFKNYAYTLTRTTSGFNTCLAEGYLVMTPSHQ